jgi:hypothetical protein
MDSYTGLAGASCHPAVMLWKSTPYHLSCADAVPGFNQAIACMVAIVGVGQILTSFCGPTARPPICVSQHTFDLCVHPHKFDSCNELDLGDAGIPHMYPSLGLGLGSATLLMTSFNHMLFSMALYAVSCSSIPSTSQKDEMPLLFY